VVSKLVRKNLILDGDELTELARLRATSASALVRELIREELAHVRLKEEMAAALQRFDDAEGFADHLQELYGPAEGSQRTAGAAS
jgi:hypothetical protein